MNRSVMEGNPHSVLEGLMIAARAIGADETLIYVRTEYPLAVARMRRAVEDAQKMGFLGDNVFGSGQSLNCEVMEGAGAFVCGEETAMIASIEGQRGMPRPKPPFPAQSGLWGKPTIINNVETLAHVVRIINQGAETFKQLGSPASPGTKTFALTGHVANTGLVEVPFGTTLRDVVLNIGGGITDRRGKVKPDGFKAVQIGGPSGGCLTQEHLDMPLDYDSLRSVGRDGRFRRSRGHERKNLHGQHRAVFHGFHPARKLRQMRALPRRHAPVAVHAGRHHRGPRHRRNPGAAWRSSRWPCKKARSAASARPRLTRCFLPCAISATNTTRTCFTSIVPPASARRWPSQH